MIRPGIADRMRIEVPGIRPGLIPSELAEDLDELRRFRHRFVNICKSQLRADRVLEVSEIAVSVSKDSGGFHTEFRLVPKLLISACRA